jgi:arylsulfatase
MDGKLVHDYNFVGRHHVVRSDKPVPEGECELSVEFRKTADFAGDCVLLINGQECGKVTVPQTFRAARGGGIGVGRAGKPSVGEFQAPFAFTGTLHKVVIDVADDQVTDPGSDLKQALGNA